ncbi:MAG: UvrB/UvrC motif-containing protein [bacterium]|nr:UvrB/UvrC motif-containing protein [bacterium]
MSKDIQPLLDAWPYDAGQLCVRKITGEDGSEKIQLRIEMGILQMDVTGRPDGQRPYGFESLFYYHQHQAKKAKSKDDKKAFVLDPETCMNLQIEALQYYHRRISFLELGEYKNAREDAQRNLDLFDFVKDYAEDEEDKLAMEQYRPFVIGHRVRAEVLLELENGDYDRALEQINGGIEEIQTFSQEFDRLDILDENEEIIFLQEWADEIRQERPKSPSQDLKEQLKEAVALEEFERAAILRDRLQDLDARKSRTPEAKSVDNV